MTEQRYRDAINSRSVALCLKYSENPEALEKLISSLKVSYRFGGIRPYFDGDKEPRQVTVLRIERNGRAIEFNYGMSLNDTWGLEGKPRNRAEEVLVGEVRVGNEFTKSRLPRQTLAEISEKLLQSIFCSVRADYYVPAPFSEFCAELGYNTDSIKDKALWERCLEQQALLKKIFTESDVDCLPL